MNSLKRNRRKEAVKAENAKLRQAMEKNEARLAKLEEKKLLRESAIPCRVQDEHSIPQNTSIILRKPKSIQSSGETILEVSSQVLPKETKVSPDYIIVQDFVQDVSSELIDEDDIQIIDGNQELTTDMTISRSVQEIIAKDN
ncbi:3713_t:CDS:2, partial [Rhizophagus irregularis]